MIENPKYHTRRHPTSRRSKREQAELQERIRTLQSENPHMDLSQLFETEKI